MLTLEKKVRFLETWKCLGLQIFWDRGMLSLGDLIRFASELALMPSTKRRRVPRINCFASDLHVEGSVVFVSRSLQENSWVSQSEHESLKPYVLGISRCRRSQTREASGSKQTRFMLTTLRFLLSVT